LRMDDDTPAVRLARALAGVRLPPGECTACLERLPDYVDAEIMGQSGAAAWREIRHHLLLCAGCAEDYVDLLEMVWLVAQDGLPPDSPKPTPDLSFLKGASEWRIANGE